MLGIIDELMAPAVIMPVIIKGGIHAHAYFIS